MKTHPAQIILRPRITEKAAAKNEAENVFVFEVSSGSNKGAVKRAVKELYKVSPTKVNIVKLPAKNVFSKGKKGKTASVVKAYVYLKKGDKIEVM